VLRQATRSSYVLAFNLPGAQRAAWAFRHTIGRARGLWRATLSRLETARVDEHWPSPTSGADVARGMGLYRANFPPKLRHPQARHCHVPVQLVIPTKDRFVPEWLFDGIEAVAPDIERRHVPARHWVVRSQPVDVAAWIAEFARDVDARDAAPAPAAEEVAG
jgi:pimeloyl-ACP methyl ester carboxylesterase